MLLIKSTADNKTFHPAIEEDMIYTRSLTKNHDEATPISIMLMWVFDHLKPNAICADVILR